jgi:RNA polymerase sigma factor (sigma-70 family)
MATASLQSLVRHLGLAVAVRNSAGVPDAQLLECFVSRRDEAAFELLVWRHGKMVLGTCRRLLRDAHEAEDAFQACFLALARRAGSVGRRGSVGGWLHRVAFRLALGAKARRATRDAREESLGDRTLPACTPDPAAEAARREVRRLLDGEVNRLPDRYRVPFVLCCLEGRSNADAARELGCPVGTVESRLSRARERLRAGLVRRGVTPAAGLLAAPANPGAASAFVPAALAASTARAATLATAGQAAAAGLISAEVATLTEGALRIMFMTQLKAAAAAVLLTVAVAGTGTGVLTYRAAMAGQPGPGTRPAPPAATDAARIARLVSQLGSDAFTDREKAAKDLDAIGAPALDALREAARTGEAEQSKRAKDLAARIEARIESAGMLAPRRVRLVYRDTPVAEAVADFKAKSGYDLSLSDPEGKLKDRTVTLDTGDVTFWQALDQFCRQARLVEAPVPDGPPPGVGGGVFRGGGFGGVGAGPIGGMMVMQQSAAPDRIVLADGRPRDLPASDGTAVRVRALGKADGPGSPADGEAVLALEVTPEPKLRWRGVTAVEVGKATDDQGQTLEQVKPVGQVPGNPVPARFKRGPKAATSLREITGTVTARVLREPQPYLTIDDVLGAAGKNFQAADGGGLRVIDVAKGPAGRVELRFAVDPPVGAAPAGGPVRVTHRSGRVVVSSAGGDGPEYELAVMDDKGVVLEPVGLGGRGGVGREPDYSATYQPRQGQGAPAKLIYTVSPNVTLNVPFTLRNVPLP